MFWGKSEKKKESWFDGRIRGMEMFLERNKINNAAIFQRKRAAEIRGISKSTRMAILK